MGGSIKIRNGYTLKLTPQLRKELKQPIGELLEGTTKQTREKIEQLIQKQKPNKIITVGDVVTQNFLNSKIEIHVMIIDNKVQRQDIQPIKAEAKRILYVKNPPGTITYETWITVQKALEQKETTKVIVDGEEDLLTLAAVIQAPIGSLVIYGQPHRGVVAVDVTAQTKEKMQKIEEAMQHPVEKPK